MLVDLYAVSIEAGFLETLQLFVIAGAFVTYGYFASMVSTKTAYYVTLKTVAQMVALVCVVLIGRETSWGSAYGISGGASDICELVMAMILIPLAIYICVLWVKHEHRKREAIVHIFDSKTIAHSLVIALFFVLSAMFDNGIIPSQSSFYEESNELLAYLAFFSYGCYFCKTHLERSVTKASMPQSLL